MAQVKIAWLPPSETTKGKLIPEDYVDDLIQRISTAPSFEVLDMIDDELYNSPRINRRMKANRDKMLEISCHITRRKYQIIDDGYVPF